jgi:hypothetical protein
MIFEPRSATKRRGSSSAEVARWLRNDAKCNMPHKCACPCPCCSFLPEGMAKGLPRNGEGAHAGALPLDEIKVTSHCSRKNTRTMRVCLRGNLFVCMRYHVPAFVLVWTVQASSIRLLGFDFSPCAISVRRFFGVQLPHSYLCRVKATHVLHFSAAQPFIHNTILWRRFARTCEVRIQNTNVACVYDVGHLDLTSEKGSCRACGQHLQFGGMT